MQGNFGFKETWYFICIFIIYYSVFFMAEKWGKSWNILSEKIYTCYRKIFTCCRARCRAARCGRWARGAAWRRRTPAGPTWACSRARTAPPTGWSSWSGSSGSETRRWIILTAEIRNTPCTPLQGNVEIFMGLQYILYFVGRRVCRLNKSCSLIFQSMVNNRPWYTETWWHNYNYTAQFRLKWNTEKK